ncbi:hypothetical protein [Lonsdalea populi]|nr:hypothetical protein [Lonsdalea populi]
MDRHHPAYIHRMATFSLVGASRDASLTLPDHRRMGVSPVVASLRAIG